MTNLKKKYLKEKKLQTRVRVRSNSDSKKNILNKKTFIKINKIFNRAKFFVQFCLCAICSCANLTQSKNI